MVRAGITLGLMFVALAVGLWQVRPPGAGEFATGRAMEHVRVIAAEPHLVGSEAHRRVGDYLVEQLRGLGMEVEEQVDELRLPLRNIMGRLRGSGGGGKAVVLAAHYDTVPRSPGAADDGAAVAAILEAVREVRSGPPLRNDLVVLLTDGEEWGMLGARVFVRRHRWSKDVGVVLNFEARGTRGASVMFETSSPNRWLIEQLAAAGPRLRPVASSVSHDIYRHMPNDTDLTIFKRAGMAGMNLAFVGGHENYHRATDDVQHLDERSLGHHGRYALGLTRHFGNLDLDAQRSDGEAIYFSLMQRWVVWYPASWRYALAGVAVAMLGWVMAVRRPSAKRLLWAMLGLAVSVAVAGVVVHLVVKALPPLRDAGPKVDWVIGGLVVLVAGIVGLGQWWVVRPMAGWDGRRDGTEVLLSGQVVWTGLAVVTAVWLPGASYLAVWPLVFSMAGLLLRRWWWVGLVVGTVPAVVLLSPIVYLGLLSLTLARAGVVAVAVGLGVWLVGPWVEWFHREGGKARRGAGVLDLRFEI